MIHHPQYGALGIDDLIAAARLAVFAQVLRSMQALGPDTPIRHAIHITFDPGEAGAAFPDAFREPGAALVSVVLQHQYDDLRVDWDGISVTLSFRKTPHRIRIPFGAIRHIADTEANYRLELPDARQSPDFEAAFRFALATLMVFQWASEATHAELEGRALFALFGAILARIAGASPEAERVVMTFDTGIVGVALPPSVAAMNQDLMSFTLSPGDGDIRIGDDAFTIECEGTGDEKWIIVPFLALKAMSIPSRSLTLALLPGPLADPLPDSHAAADEPDTDRRSTPHGMVTPPSRFPPGSVVEQAWNQGKLCLTGYVGRHSIPGLNFPDDLRQRVPLGPSTTLEILVFDEPRHNAAAFKEGPHYYAGVSHGLIQSIPGFVMSLWTRPDVAPWIGDVSRLPLADMPGDLPAGLDGFEIDDIYFRKEVESADFQEVIARQRAQSERAGRLVAALDPVRRTALQQCIEDAFHYIWLHEIGHVIWGHVDLVEDRLGMLGMAETDQARGDDLPPELGQFLEFQADGFAIDAVLEAKTRELVNAHARDRLAAPGRGMPAFVDQATIALMACVITQLVLAAHLRFKGRADVAATHPPIWFRMKAMISQAQEKAGSLAFEARPGEEIGALLGDSMSRAIGSIIATHPMLADIFQPFAEGTDAHRTAYMETFEASVLQWETTVRPYFKYARGPTGDLTLRD